jgi:8-oxo-dGTP pyrophosphatase MutT (NUDIX family)
VIGEAGEERFARALADPTIQRIRSALQAHQPIRADDEPGVRKAAVALILRIGVDGGPELLLIKRAEYPGDPWSGQVAFPGGREEAGDASLVDTATRETREETGVDLVPAGMLLGVLDDLRPRTTRLPAIVVRPFVAIVDRSEPLELSPEVALAFWVPFGMLARSESWRDDTVFARGIQLNARIFQHEDHIVWGMTERILTQLLTLIDSGSKSV